jgi:DNA replicative helicase MCM subunit Mcm2 (Cdc46/Mcm family)
LFAKDKVHILLLGDPATGKTDILRSISELAPISSYGLGSGASKAGLTMVMFGKEIVKGLLPLADNGIACIDELNLLRTADRGGLFNAMEKGFVTYDKSNEHIKLDARVKVFATANPEGERFVGRTIDVLRKQVPFDSALLTRFHLVFLIRKPGTKEFMQITSNIISGDKFHVNENDKKFVREYVKYALTQESELDKSLSPLIQGFVEDVKKDEPEFLVEISPRTVIGIMNMAKAAARMKLKYKVEKEDLIKILKIFNASLYIKKDER